MKKNDRSELLDMPTALHESDAATVKAEGQ
jgi:hypothetical protein